MYAICDGDDNLQRHLEEYDYKVQQCTNHFVKTSMYYLWKEQYQKEGRIRIKKEISKIISTLKNSVKKHRIGDFLLSSGNWVLENHREHRGHR
uniref:Uncharacterized protein n=1 Tax=Candidatus Methanogaster sp. ANME-2c ERB4 TaxID=2759911 RepID=A0A7G9YPG7_9EURY|nr:hypothetical protein GKKIKBAN_00015 [Methanosarcinales archaeon ANME-2c ERB4]